jgi:hypothetical protein
MTDAHRMFPNVEALDAWVAAAMADGWTSSPIYGDREDEGRARRLAKDGFVAQVYRRLPGHPQHPRWFKNAELNVSVWCPAGRWVRVPEVYDFDALKAASSVCDRCGKVAEMHHVAFASKACADCLPQMRQTHEYPGWNN